MAHPQIAAFARLAEGGEMPVRAIAGQKTLMARTMHAISYDPIHDEITVPQQSGQAILTFRGGADGEEAPIRVIQGSRTQLREPSRLDVDPVNDEIYVPEGDSLLVFPREANGNVAPVRVLHGPDTRLGASAVAVDPVHDLLAVATGGGGNARKAALLIFNRTDEGNVKPRAVIAGPKTGITSTRLIEVYPPRGLILVTNPGPGRASDKSFVGIWSIEDHGDVPPRWTIGGPNGRLRQVRGVALDPKNKSVIVTDKYLNSILTYYFPEIF